MIYGPRVESADKLIRLILKGFGGVRVWGGVVFRMLSEVGGWQMPT